MLGPSPSSNCGKAVFIPAAEKVWVFYGGKALCTLTCLTLFFYLFEKWEIVSESMLGLILCIWHFQLWCDFHIKKPRGRRSRQALLYFVGLSLLLGTSGTHSGTRLWLAARTAPEQGIFVSCSFKIAEWGHVCIRKSYAFLGTCVLIASLSLYSFRVTQHLDGKCRSTIHAL